MPVLPRLGCGMLAAMAAQRFRDRVVWITGAGSGLGRALALEFARQGADVAVSGRREERLLETVAAVEAEGRRGLAVPCDVTDDSAVEAAVSAVIHEFGKLDVAVANASSMIDTTPNNAPCAPGSTRPSAIEAAQTIRVNRTLTGCHRTVLKYLTESKRYLKIEVSVKAQKD